MTYPHDPNNPYGQYPPQPYAAPYLQRPVEGPGLAIGALCCAIAGIFLCVLVTIAGIVMGHIAYAKASRGEAEGKGIAMAAFIIGYVGIALGIGLTILWISLIAASGGFH